MGREREKGKQRREWRMECVCVALGFWTDQQRTVGHSTQRAHTPKVDTKTPNVGNAAKERQGQHWFWCSRTSCCEFSLFRLFEYNQCTLVPLFTIYRQITWYIDCIGNVCIEVNCKDVGLSSHDKHVHLRFHLKSASYTVKSYASSLYLTIKLIMCQGCTNEEKKTSCRKQLQLVIIHTHWYYASLGSIFANRIQVINPRLGYMFSIVWTIPGRWIRQGDHGPCIQIREVGQIGWFLSTWWNVLKSTPSFIKDSWFGRWSPKCMGNPHCFSWGKFLDDGGGARRGRQINSSSTQQAPPSPSWLRPHHTWKMKGTCTQYFVNVLFDVLLKHVRSLSTMACCCLYDSMSLLIGSLPCNFGSLHPRTGGLYPCWCQCE